MYLVYSILYTLGFVLMLPAFLWNREKYASGFQQRFGNYPAFSHDRRKVIWLHCVSVGETNAARPLVDKLREGFPDHRIVISTITKTGQELAQNIFAEKTDAIFYFPFDWKFTVRRALQHFKPSLVLLMETEIWPRFIHEAHVAGAKVAIINGRFSERSFRRYSKFRGFVSRVLADVDMALMQSASDAKRVIDLGIDKAKVEIAGNLKFDQVSDPADAKLTEYLRSRFGFGEDKLLIIAASTHEPEEKYVLDSLEGELSHSCRLMIVPRHPERFDAVEKVLQNSPYSYVRRSSAESALDRNADVILLDSIGELRSAYTLAEIVFVGGSLIPHGGQSVLEPAANGKAIITGPHTSNFTAVVDEFVRSKAMIQLECAGSDEITSRSLTDAFLRLLRNAGERRLLGQNALTIIHQNHGATERTIEALSFLIS